MWELRDSRLESGYDKDESQNGSGIWIELEVWEMDELFVKLNMKAAIEYQDTPGLFTTVFVEGTDGVNGLYP